MWKTLILLWTVNLCLSDSRIKILGENGDHLQKDSEMRNEKECRQTCRDSLTTNNLYCRKSLLLNKWCVIIRCNRLCHTNGSRLITDPPLSRNYLKRRRKRSPKGAPTSRKPTTRSTESDIPTDKTPSIMPAGETTRIETRVKPTAITGKTMPAPTEHPAKQISTSTEKAITTAATSSTAVTSTTTTAPPTTRTEPKIVPSKSSSPIILKSTDSVTPKVNVEISTSTDSTSKTIHTQKPLAISITEKPATNKTYGTTEQENIEEKTTPGRTPVLMPTTISNETSVASTIGSPVLADSSNNNTEEPLPNTSAMSSVTPTTIKEEAPFNTTVLSPATATNTTVATTQTITSEPTNKLPTTRQTVATVPTTTIPVPLVTTSSTSETTTSTTKPITLLTSTSVNPTTSKTSTPDSHVLISTTISTMSSMVDGNQKKEDDSIVIVSGEVAKHVQNTSFLLAVLLLGNMFFITIIVLFVLQAYESYKKKDYTQVDYLINGMYADSEI
ncbi:uncharacterized protein C11orf24 homolog [Hyla sarda]|uniref:uncharacterized protein C11orf24 homolog n=1 Tax=Hyla sarda TaxID=327740 RepID=UPI0024C363E1|nr:uncharacterized protein C11orf24 homolog [Hyla sarda]